MTNDIVIRTEGLGKRYKLGALQPYRTLRDLLAGAFQRGPQGGIRSEYHWALRDIDIVVCQGDVLGIVGRNGSGKTTLLKLLTRITRPTEGRAIVYGRVSALLEVGTGFHPELTGRENIYLNGSILGMSRTDIARRFDEIVDFANIEEYLDTPVKRYSSGMRVRLAFAVSAHLEPEILVIDEVLAVGDAGFQRKCLGRMNDAASEGRTVLFVSHQMEMLMSLCERAIWLDDGRIVAEGESTDIVHRYLCAMSDEQTENLKGRSDRKGDGLARITKIELLDEEGAAVRRIAAGRPCSFVYPFENSNPHRSREVRLNTAIFDSFDKVVTVVTTRQTDFFVSCLPSRGSFMMHIPKMPLVPGRYWLEFALRIDGTLSDKVYRAFHFEVLPAPYYGGTTVPKFGSGRFFLDHEWSIQDSRLDTSPE